MMFVMSAYYNLRDRRYIRTVLFSLLAIMFHYSAFIALIILFFCKSLKPSRLLFWTSVLVGLLGTIFLPVILKWFFTLVPSAAGYSKYLSWSRNSQMRLVLAMVGSCATYFVLILILVRNKNQIKTYDCNRYNEISFLIIGLCINLLSIRIWVAGRLSYYFYQFIIFSIPALIDSSEGIKKKNLKKIIFIIMAIWMIFSSIFLGENEYYSYSTIWNNTVPMTIPTYNALNDYLK